MTTKVLEANLSIASCVVRQFGVPGKAIPVNWLKKEARCSFHLSGVPLLYNGLLSCSCMCRALLRLGDQDVSLFGLGQHNPGHRAQRCMEDQELVLLHCPTCKGLQQASSNPASFLA